MKVILLKELKGKGGEGDVIDVAPGFANNYLLTQGYAILATKGNLKQLEQRKHNIAKREEKRIADAEDDLLDAADDLEDIFKFFPNQQRIWDKAAALLRDMKREREYLAASTDATEALATIERVFDAASPYNQINLLSGAMQTVEDAYDEKLNAKRQELLDRIESIYADIEAKAEQSEVKLAAIGQRKLSRRDMAHDTRSLSDLDALAIRLNNDQTDFYTQIDAEVERRKPKPQPSGTGGKTHTPPAPAKPARIKRVERSLIFKPETLRTEADIDRYLDRVRAELVRDLAGNDGIRIQ